MTLSFIGHGYVGLVTAAVFADLGNTVWVVGRNAAKIQRLNSGDPLIYEPGLEEILKRNLKAGRIKFTLDYKKSISKSDIVFICVGTPPKKNGEADLSSVFAVAETIGKNLSGYTVVVTKSTVPPGTNRKVKKIVEQQKPENAEFDIASSPEFLREGTGISDTLVPDRIVLGVQTNRAKELLLEVHKQINGKRVIGSIETAEMIKYASNAFLSTKISFANALAFISEKVDADVEKVLEGMGLDNRIGHKFLNPGVGYGGSCFPKDVKALIAISKKYGYQFKLLEEVEAINNQAIEFFVNKISHHFKGKENYITIAILGLSFKPNTDDMRQSPSVAIINKLSQKGFTIHAYDPVAMPNAKQSLPKSVVFEKSAYMAAKGADAVAVVTEWDEFRQLDLTKLKNNMNTPVLFDGRNIYDPKKARNSGFTYYSIGRPT